MMDKSNEALDAMKYGQRALLAFSPSTSPPMMMLRL